MGLRVFPPLGDQERECDILSVNFIFEGAARLESLTQGYAATPVQAGEWGGSLQFLSGLCRCIGRHRQPRLTLRLPWQACSAPKRMQPPNLVPGTDSGRG